MCSDRSPRLPSTSWIGDDRPFHAVDAAVRDAGVDDATATAIVDDYEDASLKALKAGLLAAAFLALFSLAFTGDLPHDPPSRHEDVPDDAEEAVPA